MRRRKDAEQPFAGLGDSSPTFRTEHAQEQDDFPKPSPNRANVLAALAIADDETDLDMSGYYVQRAIAESLLLVVDRLADLQAPSAGS
jgi:phosphoglycolate phosphatase-like HAD superfamily hydrolase